MIGTRWMAALSALAVATPGCGGTTVIDDGTGGGGTGGEGTGGEGMAGTPLLGVWDGSATFPPTVLTEQVTIRADGTATATETFAVIGSQGAGACTGAFDIQDNWTSTSSTFLVSGGKCTGQITCPDDTVIACGNPETAPQTCTYTLSDGGDTLTLDCPESPGPITYTRGG